LTQERWNSRVSGNAATGIQFSRPVQKSARNPVNRAHHVRRRRKQPAFDQRIFGQRIRQKRAALLRVVADADPCVLAFTAL
jgi:hypothetical protein